MRISFAIPVCNEHKELDRLLTQLVRFKQPNDEIVIQCDQGNTTQEVYAVISKFDKDIRVIQFPLKGNFAAFKNNLKKNCTGDWIFQIDADEYLSEELAYNIHDILKENPKVHLFLVPRVNTVEGLTQDHINRWSWRVDDKGWVNFPDYQTRILQNIPKIMWVSKVHEVLTGHDNYTLLPASKEYSLYHPKDIVRQERQNNYYNTL